MARMRISLVAATATIAALAAPTTALAGETSCDGLQTELSTATEGEVVTLVDNEVCVGQWTLPSHAITLQGGTGVATLSGEGDNQILRGDGVGTTTIRNLTFIDGLAEGEQNYERSGGAISLTGSSPVTIEDNQFFANEADDDGGAVAILEDTQVESPQARGDGPPIVLRGNTFGGPEEGNGALDEGGAVYIYAFRNVEVDGNTFADNDAQDDGGGMEIEQSEHVTLTGNTFSRNVTLDNGGGAAIESCTAEITGNTFDANRLFGGRETSPDGGGLYLDGSGCFDDVARGAPSARVIQADNRFTANVIDGNGDSGSGGGEYISDTTVVSTSDRFVGNRIDDYVALGGGLYLEGGSNDTQPFIARNLVAAGNELVFTEPPSRGKAQNDLRGGGLFLVGNRQQSELRIEDSTIEGNTAERGSGIAGDVSFQEGDARGEGGTIQGDALVLLNSIVHGNTGADDVAGIPFDGEIEGFFARDVRSTDTCVEGAAHPDGDGAAPNSNICADPKLADPDVDGNVDQAADSPTVDAGDNELVDPDLLEDYAGDGRVLDGNGDATARVDMGADEYKPVPPEPTPETVPPAAQPPQGAVQGQTQRSCRSKRVFRIRIRVPRGKKARSATVRVNNKKVKVVRGKRLRAPVTLRGLPKGRFTVRITVRLTNGKKITGKRVYNTCIPKLPGDGPPKV